jgi:hypothetical protein
MSEIAQHTGIHLVHTGVQQGLLDTSSRILIHTERFVVILTTIQEHILQEAC